MSFELEVTFEYIEDSCYEDEGPESSPLLHHRYDTIMLFWAQISYALKAVDHDQ